MNLGGALGAGQQRQHVGLDLGPGGGVAEDAEAELVDDRAGVADRDGADGLGARLDADGTGGEDGAGTHGSRTVRAGGEAVAAAEAPSGAGSVAR
jgi:hypothetical protein